MAEEKQCVLVLIGADEWGHKKIIGLADGYRESTQSWRELLLDLQRRGLTHAPDLAIGDGALGFWNALREVFGATKEQRCWFHKTGNVLNAMPKSVQAKAKGHLHDIWQAETSVDAEAAFDYFVATYDVKYDKAVAKLTKDRDVLLEFYDFPAEHWKHITTTNPIESGVPPVKWSTHRDIIIPFSGGPENGWKAREARGHRAEAAAGLSSARARQVGFRGCAADRRDGANLLPMAQGVWRHEPGSAQAAEGA